MVKQNQKPNVTRRKVRGRDGITRIYFYYEQTLEGRRKLVRLPNDPNSQEFDRRYWEIKSGKAYAPKPKLTFEKLIGQYIASSGYKNKADGTKKKYRPILEHIREKNGPMDFTKMRRKDVLAAQEAFSETPRKADYFVQMLSILFNYAIEREDMTHNPACGVKLYGPQSEMEPWPQDKQDAYIRYCERNKLDTELLAFYLGTGTGQRPGDLCQMKWEHFDGEYMFVLQEKTKTRIRVFCPDNLLDALAKFPRQGDYILARNLREPLTYNILQKKVLAVRKAIEATNFTMHGWRFTAAVELAEAGASDSEIQSVTGHKTLKMVQKYRDRANQAKLSKTAQTRRNRERGQNENKT